MAEQDILQSVYPYIGGQENVSRTIPRKGTLYLMLKGAGCSEFGSSQSGAGRYQ